jgi:hypothetical protein
MRPLTESANFTKAARAVMGEFIKASSSHRKGSRIVRQCGRAAGAVAKKLKGTIRL